MHFLPRRYNERMKTLSDYAFQEYALTPKEMAAAEERIGAEN
jgi:hypothetical protein